MNSYIEADFLCIFEAATTTTNNNKKLQRQCMTVTIIIESEENMIKICAERKRKRDIENSLSNNVASFKRLSGCGFLSFYNLPIL